MHRAFSFPTIPNEQSGYQRGRFFVRDVNEFEAIKSPRSESKNGRTIHTNNHKASDIKRRYSVPASLKLGRFEVADYDNNISNTDNMEVGAFFKEICSKLDKISEMLKEIEELLREFLPTLIIQQNSNKIPSRDA